MTTKPTRKTTNPTNEAPGVQVLDELVVQTPFEGAPEIAGLVAVADDTVPGGYKYVPANDGSPQKLGHTGGTYGLVVDEEAVERKIAELQRSIGKAPETSTASNGTVKEKPVRSPFRTHANFCAGQMQIDGVTYWYRELTDSLKTYLEKRGEHIAQELGVSADAFTRDHYAIDTPANRAAIAKLPAEQRPELTTAEKLARLPGQMEETYDHVLSHCLIDCDYPGADFTVDPDLKKQLSLSVKKALFIQIRLTTETGNTQQNFFQGGAA